MRYLLTALLTMALIAPFAWSRITLLPSDDTAGGGAGDVPFSYGFGTSSTSAWPVTTGCMRSMASQGSVFADCNAVAGITSASVVPYIGTIYIKEIVCTPAAPLMTTWHANSYIDITVYEVEGDDSGIAFARNAVGGALQFTVADSVMVSKRLVINAWVTLADASLQVGFSDANLEAATEEDNSFACVVSGVR